MRTQRTWPGLLLSALVCGSCATQMRCNEPGPDHRCVQTGGPQEAVITGAAAAGLWAAGGGCNLAGCHPPMVCNRSTGFCEHVRCGEALPPCPERTYCDQLTKTCR
jgi:hypothetical protein